MHQCLRTLHGFIGKKSKILIVYYFFPCIWYKKKLFLLELIEHLQLIIICLSRFRQLLPVPTSTSQFQFVNISFFHSIPHYSPGYSIWTNTVNMTPPSVCNDGCGCSSSCTNAVCLLLVHTLSNLNSPKELSFLLSPWP